MPEFTDIGKQRDERAGVASLLVAWGKCVFGEVDQGVTKVTALCSTERGKEYVLHGSISLRVAEIANGLPSDCRLLWIAHMWQSEHNHSNLGVFQIM